MLDQRPYKYKGMYSSTILNDLSMGLILQLIARAPQKKDVPRPVALLIASAPPHWSILVSQLRNP